ncbi:unnamed protein product [Musa banksii]
MSESKNAAVFLLERLKPSCGSRLHEQRTRGCDLHASVQLLVGAGGVWRVNRQYSASNESRFCSSVGCWWDSGRTEHGEGVQQQQMVTTARCYQQEKRDVGLKGAATCCCTLQKPLELLPLLNRVTCCCVCVLLPRTMPHFLLWNSDA